MAFVDSAAYKSAQVAAKALFSSGQTKHAEVRLPKKEEEEEEAFPEIEVDCVWMKKQMEANYSVCVLSETGIVSHYSAYENVHCFFHFFFFSCLTQRQEPKGLVFEQNPPPNGNCELFLWEDDQQHVNHLSLETPDGQDGNSWQNHHICLKCPVT